MSEKKNHSVAPEEKETILVPVPEVTNVEEPTVVKDEPTFVIGTVVGCRKLNVREQMNIGATVLCVLPVSAEVQVYADEHHDEWCRVITKTGFDGFCMKKYIHI